MAQQFENPGVKRAEDETVSTETAQKANERVAEEAAVKGAKTVQKYDKDHKIFTI